MKNHIDITSTVSLDEIAYQMVNDLETKEIIAFALRICDNSSYQEDYIRGLHKATAKLVKLMDK